MRKTWTNPDPNLHSDLIASQIKIFSLIRDRFLKDGKTSDAHKLRNEIVCLMSLRHDLCLNWGSPSSVQMLRSAGFFVVPDGSKPIATVVTTDNSIKKTISISSKGDTSIIEGFPRGHTTPELQDEAALTDSALWDQVKIDEVGQVSKSVVIMTGTDMLNTSINEYLGVPELGPHIEVLKKLKKGFPDKVFKLYFDNKLGKVTISSDVDIHVNNPDRFSELSFH